MIHFRDEEQIDILSQKMDACDIVFVGLDQCMGARNPTDHTKVTRFQSVAKEPKALLHVQRRETFFTYCSRRFASHKEVLNSRHFRCSEWRAFEQGVVEAIRLRMLERVLRRCTLSDLLRQTSDAAQHMTDERLGERPLQKTLFHEGKVYRGSKSAKNGFGYRFAVSGSATVTFRLRLVVIR